MPIPRYLPLFEDEALTMNTYKQILLDNDVIYSVSEIENINIYFPHQTAYLKTFLSEDEIRRGDIIYTRLIKKGYLLLIQPKEQHLLEELLKDGYMPDCFLTIFKEDWEKLPDYFKQDYELLDTDITIQSMLN